jgi:lysozyme
MNENLQFDHDGIDLVKLSEGCKLTSYQCPAGIWTIGFGSTGADVIQGMTITEEQAVDRLKHDLQHAEKMVKTFVTVELTQHQYDALVDFCFNCGAGNLQHSTLLKLINQGNFEAAHDEFEKWNKAGGRVLAGLTTRRLNEAKLFAQG